MDAIIYALTQVGYFKGVTCEDHSDIVIDGKNVDNYLFVLTLAQRISSGDVEIVEKGDTCKAKDYYDRLLESIRKSMVNETS